ncbi:MAG: T9SS type A sorting domain-containing protein [Ignavibacteria bacterium]|nr:T9SS type A sorting domain-containing protein [Ignavibacteria bacterium]
MKNYIFKIFLRSFTITSLIFITASFCNSQIFPWSQVKNITTGHVDKNPGFGTKQEEFGALFDWEFLVFERHNGSSSDICVLKIDNEGPSDSVVYLTNDLFLDRNPSISYDEGAIFIQTVISNSLALWETNRNGRWDVYASYYNINTGWQNPFPVDTSSYNKSHPRSVNIGNSNFALVYERDNDIIFKILNAQTQTISYDSNLTITDSLNCLNPFISKRNSIYVSYEKVKPDNEKQIDFRRSPALPNWTAPDTIAFLGNNINSGFVGSFNDPINIFSSDRLGNYNIYGTSFNSFESQKPVVINESSENTNYESYLSPIVTDGGFYNHANAYIKKTDSVKIIFSDYALPRDSSVVSDSSAHVSLTMNRGLKSGQFDAVVWVVFNKDSLTFTNLCARSVLIIISDIKQISSEVPSSFMLYQNFPNPFNPMTKIKFDIPQTKGNTGENIRLIIYDQLGKEIERLVDNNLNYGSYEVSWYAGKYSSGMYFYKLISDDFSFTKKMLLLK